ncbi:MAG: hypothetical protein WA210_13320 [Burkholderiaceae bacterium]
MLELPMAGLRQAGPELETLATVEISRTAFATTNPEFFVDPKPDRLLEVFGLRAGEPAELLPLPGARSRAA